MSKVDLEIIKKYCCRYSGKFTSDTSNVNKVCTNCEHESGECAKNLSDILVAVACEYQKMETL